MNMDTIVEHVNKGGKAIHLVRLIQKGMQASNEDRLQLTEEGRSFLETLQGVFAVIIVCGKARGGKSFLINSMLLNLPPNESAFVVGSTVQICTRGLWCFSAPITYIKPDGTRIQALVVDTEGLFACSATKTNDIKIFSLGVLLSSLLIYNATGSIDESQIETLDLAASISRHIKIQGSDMTEEGETDTEEQRQELGAKYFPPLMIALRDFSLALEDDRGRVISENDYMENALREVQGADAGKNEIRKRLKQLFIRRQCVTLVRPVTDESDLRKLGTREVALDRIRPEFLHDRYKMQKLVARELQVKTVMGKQVTGRVFAKLVEAYCDAMNKPESVPVLKDCWSQLNEVHFRDAKDAGTRMLYDLLQQPALQTAVPEEYDRQCTRIREQVMHTFDAKIDVQDREQPVCVQLRQQLQQEMDGRFKEMRVQYEAKLEEWMSAHLAALETQLPQCKTIEQLRTVWTQAHVQLHQRLGLQAGHERSLVPLVNSVLNKWRLKLNDERLINWMKRLCDLQLQELLEKVETTGEQLRRVTEQHTNCEQTQADQTQRLEVYRQEKAAAETQLDTLRQQWKEQQTQYESAATQQGLELSQLRQELQFMSSQAENVQQELTRHMQCNTETLMEKEKLLTTLQLEIDDVKRQFLTCQSEFDQCLQDLKATREQVREIEEWERKVDELQHLFQTSQDNLHQSQTEHRLLQSNMDEIRDAYEKMAQLMDTQEYQASLDRQQRVQQIEELTATIETQRKQSVTQLKQVQDQLCDAQRQIVKCQEEKQAHEARHERELATLHADVQSYKHRLQQKEEEYNKSLTQVHQEYREEVQRKNQEINQLHKNRLTEQLESSKLIDKAKSDAARALETLEDHKRRLENSDDIQRSKRLKVENDRLLTENQYQQSNIQMLTQQKVELQKELQESNKRYRELETRNNDMTSKHLLETMRLKIAARGPSATGVGSSTSITTTTSGL